VVALGKVRIDTGDDSGAREVAEIAKVYKARLVSWQRVVVSGR
jgi:alkylated DNA nucleotide flippase Atl1